MKKNQKSQKSQSRKKVPYARPESKWRVESDDGRFEIDRCSDGALMIVDRAQWNPDDENDLQGLFTVLPEDRTLFMQLMNTALATEVLQDADLFQSDTCPEIAVVKAPKQTKKPSRRKK